jgi:D-alanyl-D-alanine carboxypeptidase
LSNTSLPLLRPASSADRKSWRFTATALAALTVALAGCGGGGDDAPPPSTVEQVFTAVVDMTASQENVQGLTVGLRTDDGQTWMRSGGYRDVAKTKAMESTLQYRIGSATKTFTATAVLQLVDQRLVNLDDLVSVWLPELNLPNADKITVRDLLQMRSGLPEYLAEKSLHYPTRTVLQEWSNFDNFKGTGVFGDADYTPADLMKVVAGAKASHFATPDTFMSYANSNYVLLGMIAEKASCYAAKGCQSIATLINDGIAKPLGMTGTYFPSDKKFTSANYSEAYQQILDSSVYLVAAGSHMDMTSTDPRVPWAAGAMLSTPADELIWARELALNEKKLLSDATFLQRMTPKKSPVGTGTVSYIPVRYGMGVYYLPSIATGTELIGHSGLIGGYNTSVFYSPSLKMAMSINITGVLANPVAWFPLYGAEDAYFGAFRTDGGFHSQSLVWNLERNLRLAIENTGSCSTLGATAGDGGSGTCEKDSVRTRTLDVTNRSLTIKPSERTFNAKNIVTGDTDETFMDAWLEDTTLPRPSLAIFGSSISGVTVGDGGKATLQANAILETIGVGSNGIALTGTGGDVTVAGVIRSMGKNTVALRVADTAKANTVTVASGANVQGDLVLTGETTLTLNGTVNGAIQVSGTKVKITGTGKATGGIKLASGAALATGSDITKITSANLEKAQSVNTQPLRKLPPLYFQ